MRLQSFPIPIIIIVVPFLCLTVAGCGDNDSPPSATPLSAAAGAADAPPPPDAPPASSCGDALVQAAETCDDGNQTDGDGCSAECVMEEGFFCQGEPSTCAPGCGDGIVAGPEGCDDHNEQDGDGCDATCQVEEGFECSGSGPGSCQPVCGDGLIVAGETCDDENAEAGDGCDSTCSQETGWTCTSEPSKCSPVCGDGVMLGSEQCDDNNEAPGDGCSDACEVEPGYACTDLPTSTCAPVCGDGLRVGDEVCDDGNLSDDDACSSSCQLACGAANMLQDVSGSCYAFSATGDLVTWEQARKRCALTRPAPGSAAPTPLRREPGRGSMTKPGPTWTSNPVALQRAQRRRWQRGLRRDRARCHAGGHDRREPQRTSNLCLRAGRGRFPLPQRPAGGLRGL